MNQTAALSLKNDKLIKTLSYYLAFITLGMAAAALGPTLSGLAQNTGTQMSQISILFTARSLGYLLGSWRGGRLFDQLPGHVVIAVGLAAMAATMLAIPLIPALWLLALLLLLLGIGESILDIGGNTLLVWIHRAKVPPYMNALHFSFGLGAFLAPLIIGQVLGLTNNITWAYWILGLLMIPVALWLLRLPSPALGHHHEEEGRPPADMLLVGLIALFFFLYVGAEVSYGGWIAVYAEKLKLADQVTAAYLASAFWGALTLGRLLAIPITARLRPGLVLAADLTGCLASLGLILLWPHSLLAVALGTFGLGLAMASIFPVTLSLAERILPITGQITGKFFVGGSIGAMILPWLVGQFIDTVGPQATMIIIGLDLLAAVAVFIALLFFARRSTGHG